LGISSRNKKLMQYEFKILAFTNESKFSIELATECNKYGFSLDFLSDIKGIDDFLGDDIIAAVIIDLNDDTFIPFEICNKIKNVYGLPVFGVLNKFSKDMQEKAKKNGYDLIFTKKMLIRSIRDVIIHVSNE